MARMRVWVFGKVDFTQVSIKDLEDKFFKDKQTNLFKKGDNDYVLVRADVVDDFTINGNVCNIIIPVDAYNTTGLNKAKSEIANNLKVNILKTVTVKNHIPDPPHLSHGYITRVEISEEVKFTNKPSFEKPGRQFAKSPGANKWG